MKPLKIRKVGNSLGLILPKEMLDELGLGEGDEVFATKEGHKAFSISVPDDRHDEIMRLAREGMDEYAEALAELAK